MKKLQSVTRSLSLFKYLILFTSLFAFEATAEIQFSGFASVVGGIATGDDVIVDGAGVDGYNDKFDFNSGSFFAIQASSDLGDNLSATVQMMSTGSDDWDVEFTWAYLSYDINDDWRVLAGRQRIPFYSYSDYLDVSYAYHWIKPPTEVYDVPFSSIDGISSIYTLNFENSSLTTHVLYGTGKTDLDGFNLTLEFDDVVGGALTYNYDWLTLRAAYFQFESDFSGLGSGKGTIVVQDISAQIDYNDWLFIAEYSPVDFDELITGQESKPWMLSVAKRIDTITLHATAGKNKLTAPSATAMGGRPGRDTSWYIVGARWDFHDSAALKFEYSGEEDIAGNKAQSLQIGLVTVF